MKKKIALILCIVLCMSVFAGCSSAEVGYFGTAQEMMKMDQLKETGSVEVYFDADALKGFVTEQAVKNKWATKAEVDELFTGFTGTNKILVDFDGNMEMKKEGTRLVMDYTVTVDGIKMPIGKLYISMKDGIYGDRDLLWNVYQLAEKLMPTYASSAEYRNEMKAALTGDSYIQIVSMADMMGVDGEGIEEMMATDMDYDAIYTAAIKFLVEGFKDYSTNAVTEVAGGYRVAADGEAMVKMTSDFLGYAITHFDQLAPAYMAYCKTIADVMKLDVEDSFDKPIDSKTKGMLVGMITTVKSELDQMTAAGTLDLMKPFAYEETLKKLDNGYVDDCNLTMTVNGKQIAYVKSSAKVVPSTEKIVYPTKGTPLDGMMTKVSAVTNKYNPIKSAVVVWDKTTPANYDATYNLCMVDYYRDKDMMLSNKLSQTSLEYKTVDQQMYLPLRSVCESLGETVGWDDAANQAYITRDGAKTVMNGIVVRDTTYVKVRDFEKLGYTVTYDGSASTAHKTTIAR